MCMTSCIESRGTGADCKVSNTWMFQGQSFEGGTFEGQLVRWSVKIVRELPYFSFLKEKEDNFFHNLVVYLSESHIFQWYLLSYVDDIHGLLQRPHWTFMRKKREGNWEERYPNLNRMHLISVLFCQDHLDYITSNNSW